MVSLKARIWNLKFALLVTCLLSLVTILWAQGPGAFKVREIVSSAALTLYSGTNQNIVLTPGGTGVVSARNLASSVNTVTFSATPTFDASLGNTQKLTLTANVTSSTLSNANAGEHLDFIICQDSGGSHSFAWPANVNGATTVDATASTCSAQSFIFDGSTAYALAVAGNAGGVANFVWLTPGTGDSGKWRAYYNTTRTITKIYCSTDGLGTVSLNFEIRPQDSPNNTGTTVLTDPLVCTGSGTETSTILNDTIPGTLSFGYLVVANVTETSGSPGLIQTAVVTQ